MNKYELNNLREAINDTKKGIHRHNDNRVLTSGGSNIDEIDVDLDSFLKISRCSQNNTGTE